MKLILAVVVAACGDIAIAQQAAPIEDIQRWGMASSAYNRCVADYAKQRAFVDASPADIATAGLVACSEEFIKMRAAKPSNVDASNNLDREWARDQAIYAVVEERSKRRK